MFRSSSGRAAPGLSPAANGSALVYEGEWLADPDGGHQVLITSPAGGRSLQQVDGVRHVVEVDGRCLHSDILVNRLS